MSSKQKQNIDTRRVKVFKMLTLTNKPTDEFALMAAKKTGVSKVTIYSDMKYIKANIDYFNSKLD
jgi:hypothetical protein